jgi:hypothetical protein
MMHPDQMYTLRQLQHHDLRAEAEQARARRELIGNRTARGSAWFETWLRYLGLRRTRSATPTP